MPPLREIAPAVGGGGRKKAFKVVPIRANFLENL